MNQPSTSQLDLFIADAVLGIDTLWGGDVMCPSGTGRFIADSWFSDEPLPAAYTHPAAARLRESGGVGGKTIDRDAVEAYLRAVESARGDRGPARWGCRVRRTAPRVSRGPRAAPRRRCGTSRWKFCGKGDPVPYTRAVEASTGKPPEPSRPEAKRERVAELLGRAGYSATQPGGILGRRRCLAARARHSHGFGESSRRRRSSRTSTRSAQKISFRICRRNSPQVPRANIDFLPIKEAWFSGSMNYIGRARNASGSPLYEASYEINASLEISYPEFEQLVSHEVVPGHVTTFAYLQDLYVRGKAGFEATVLTMNTRAATLFEGIANNAILIAHGITEVDQLPDEDLQIGVLLALLQDDAKNQSSYMTWGEGRAQQEVAATLRRDFLVTEERANKLSGAWGQHPLLGRMYLPAYRAGTDKVAELRRKHPAVKVLPALYGCQGLVDIQTIDQLLNR